MEFIRKRSGMWNFTFVTILTFIYETLVMTLKTDPSLQRNILRFCYGSNYKYGEQLSHSVDKYYVVVKF